ncbi:DUF2637 domain-containing protein [Kitasatospora purpeofusca]|uniref:DUF2637 domain-containing protein n=1 Tax=Kitasatospora purpeofusca TaxID=67352 RepID=UPI0035DCE8F9
MNAPPNPLALSLSSASWLPDSGWIGHHTDQILAVLVVAIAALLVVRAWRRSEAAYELEQTLSPEDIKRRDALADRRGRQGDDLGVIVVALAAAKLSSDGLRKLGHDVIGLVGYWDWLPFLALDVAAYVCGRRARRRSRNNEPPGLSGLLVWVLAATSSAFSASEATTVKGQIARAIWPIIAAVLFELGSIEERGASRRRLREAGEWLDRRLRLLRLFHPFELVRVALALAADADLSQADATRMVRIQCAAQRLYVLRVLVGRVPAESRPETRSRRKDKAKRPVSLRSSWFPLLRLRLASAERRAQAAQTRVRAEDHDAVLASLRRLVRTREFAALDFDDSEAVETLRATTLDDRPEAAGLTSAADGGPLPYPGREATITGTGVAGVLTSTGTPQSAARPYPFQQGYPSAVPVEAGVPASSHPAEARVHPAAPEVHLVQDGVYLSGPQVYPVAPQVYPAGVPAHPGTPEVPYLPAEPVHPVEAQVYPPSPTRQQDEKPEAVDLQVEPGRPRPDTVAAPGGAAGVGRSQVGAESAQYPRIDSPPAAPIAPGRAARPSGAGADEAGRGDGEVDEESGKRWSPEDLAVELLQYVNEAGDRLTIGVSRVKSQYGVGQTVGQKARDLALDLHRAALAKAAQAVGDPHEEGDDRGADSSPVKGPVKVPAQGVLRELADAGV